MRKTMMLTAALTLVMAASLSLAALAAERAEGRAAIGQAAPGFTLNDQNGKAVSLSDYKGEIVVLQWTNKDCPYIQRHMRAKTFTKLADKYKDKGVVWLAIDSSRTHNAATNLKTVTEHHLPYPILDDSAGNVGHAYGAKSTPDMFVIKKDGTVAYSGAIDNDVDGNKKDRISYVSQALDEVLAGKNVSVPETKSYGCSVKYAK